jgi:hypothetical protein
MSTRMADAILQGAYSTGRNQPMVDIKYGGSNAYAPDFSQWVSSTHYVRRNVIAILIEAPALFSLLPNPSAWILALKSLVETQVKTIEGLDQGLEATFAETAFGGSGEMFHDITNVKLKTSNVTMGATDLYGRPIQNFIADWLTLLGMDPYSKFPQILTLGGAVPSDLLNDQMMATIMFLEPDPTHTKVAKAWLGTNMMPKGTGDIQGKRDLNSDGELAELNIEWTGLYQVGYGVTQFAQALLTRMSLLNANPMQRSAFIQAIDADVDAVGMGYASSISTLASESAVQF